MLVVEPARASDVEHVVRLSSETLSRIPLPVTNCWVARDVAKDAILGFALTGQSAPCEAQVLALAVDRAHRGEGLGAALMRAIRDNVRQAGAKRLVLDVRADNAQAQGFYQKHGFTPEGLQQAAYEDGEDAIRFARPL